MKLLAFLLFAATSAAGLAAAGPLPALPPPPPAPAPAAPTTTSWMFKMGSSELEIHTKGGVTLSADSAVPFEIEEGGRLRVRERSAKHVRVLTARKGRVVWTVDGKERGFDDEGKRWLRAILKARPATPLPPIVPKK